MTLSLDQATSRKRIPRRKIVHMAMLIFAFLLPFLTWMQAAGCAVLALLFNVFILPQLDVDLRKNPEGTGVARTEAGVWTGIIIYPLSVLALILIYRHDIYIAAAVWAVMALGDGVAGVAGAALRGPALRWNKEKTWSGFCGFVLAGSLGAYALTRWAAPELDTETVWAASVATAVVGAFVESLPIRLDDNVSVPLVCGPFIYCAYLVDSAAMGGNMPYLPRRLAFAVLVNLFCAVLAVALGWANRSGATAGFLLGAVIYLGYGFKSFLVLLAFILMGSLATRVGYAKKAARGVAERRGGRRSWREAFSNLLAPATFAVLATTTYWQAAFLLALVASLAEAAGDTVSSEIGEIASSRAYLITTFRAVPPGENGGVSIAGTAAGLAASAIVVGIAYALGMCGPRPLTGATIALAAALAGNLFDSLLGATLERRGLLTNGTVNFSGTSFAGVLAFLLASHLRGA
jgi:uncharacterized protein (TIGR00297 family)